MDPMITSMATSIATTILTKGADAPSDTLSLLWKVTFGRWDPLLEHLIEDNCRKYAEDISKKIKEILNGHN